MSSTKEKVRVSLIVISQVSNQLPLTSIVFTQSGNVKTQEDIDLGEVCFAWKSNRRHLEGTNKNVFVWSK